MVTVQDLINKVKTKDGHEKEFVQAAEEVLISLKPLLESNPKYMECMERILEPERVIIFRVPWIDRNGVQQVNRGFRVQYNSAIGPYKGGLRFHPSVNLGVIKFLGFEQIFKNSLTTLPMGGGKGGCDFDPKGKNDEEVMRFCQSFMTELHKHIGGNIDVPAGDIGVGGREIGFLYGAYKRFTNRFEGVLTGKGLEWGGSLIRPEATGYGTVYFAKETLDYHKTPMKGKRCIVSGAGNVAQYCCEKLLDFEAIPLTFSDSGGYVVCEEGFDRKMLAEIMELKNVKRGRLSEYKNPKVKYVAGKRPWEVNADLAFPCATQNEINEQEAEIMAKNKVLGVFEGANMPSSNEAVEVYKKNKMWYGLGKAANAGGVAVSGLEMSQNSMRLAWTREEVDNKLKQIMHDIHAAAIKASEELGCPGDLQLGANAAGFLKVAKAMIAQGCVQV